MGKFLIIAVFVALCILIYAKINTIPKPKNADGELAEITSKENEI